MQIKLSYYKSQPFIVIIGLLWAVSSWGLSHIWDYGLLQGLGPTAIVMSTLYLYDKWLWKIPCLNLINTAPNLNGIYEGTISFYHNGKNSEKYCKVKIKQTCSNLKVKSFFTKDGEDETHSTSLEAFISTDEHGDQRLYFYYHNPGSSRAGNTLYAHDGMNVLDIIIDKNSIVLRGYYFTNRNPQTKGSMEVTQKLKGDK